MTKLPPDFEKIHKKEGPRKYPSTYSLDKKLHDDFRKHCKDGGESASHVVESLIRWYLKHFDK